MPKIVVVLPTYNEAPNLELMVEALLGLGIDNLHVLVVDDNSPDGTGQIADRLAQTYPDRVQALHNPHKGGLGPAYKVGFEHALRQGADYVMQMDTDFSHQPKYVPQLIAKISEGYDIVLGSRYAKGGGVDESWGWYRKLLSWFANRVYVATILGFNITDATGGFRIISREAVIGMGMERVRSSGYVFQVETAYVAYKLGYRIGEVPIYFPDRQRGESKMGGRIILEAALRVWQTRQRHQRLTPADRYVETQAQPG